MTLKISENNGTDEIGLVTPTPDLWTPHSTQSSRKYEQ